MDDRIAGLDLFSGIGGITLALSPWVRPVAYCEIDPFCRAVLASRMADGSLPTAPVWDDVRTLAPADLPVIDIIYGGFPCQDISTAGTGKGLEGKRSGLVFEIFRLARELKPRFIFLENVPAIRTRGAERVVKTLSEIGYDCRWDTLSAYDVGAPHKRERWWCLAHANFPGRDERSGDGSELPGGHEPQDGGSAPDADGAGRLRQGPPQPEERRGHPEPSGDRAPDVGGSPDDSVRGRHGLPAEQVQPGRDSPFDPGWWAAEPAVGRVVNGVPGRVDRVRALGNAVVPACAREAFKRLMDIQG